jgi:hypothetical protein
LESIPVLLNVYIFVLRCCLSSVILEWKKVHKMAQAELCILTETDLIPRERPLQSILYMGYVAGALFPYKLSRSPLVIIYPWFQLPIVGRNPPVCQYIAVRSVNFKNSTRSNSLIVLLLSD